MIIAFVNQRDEYRRRCLSEAFEVFFAKLRRGDALESTKVETSQKQDSQSSEAFDNFCAIGKHIQDEQRESPSIVLTAKGDTVLIFGVCLVQIRCLSSTLITCSHL